MKSSWFKHSPAVAGHAFGTLVAFIALAGASSVEAHDFWVQPERYWVNADALTPLTLQVGHGPSRQRSPIPLNRITRFEAVTPQGGSIDLRNRLQSGLVLKDGDFQFRDPGSHVLVLQTDNRAQTRLPAIRFNEYLKVEGLTPALERRAATRRTGADGSEIYSRSAKSIVQVGASDPRPQAQTQVTRAVGLTLEIVPERSPYETPRSETLPVRVVYEGHPLAGALVKLTNLAHDDDPFETRLTDRSGRASFTMPSKGDWLLNVIWTKSLPTSSETDFETVFSSLSFGFQP